MIQARGIETQLLIEMIQLEREISKTLRQKDALSAEQIQKLEMALAAKDRVIAAYEAEIVGLKKNRWGFWKKVQAVGVGVAVGIVMGSIITK